MAEVMLDTDDHPKCRNLSRSRPNASDSPSDSYDIWLDPGMQNVTAISELLKPYDARQMRCFPVSSRVGNDDKACSRPIAVAEGQAPLFSLADLWQLVSRGFGRST